MKLMVIFVIAVSPLLGACSYGSVASGYNPPGYTYGYNPPGYTYGYNPPVYGYWPPIYGPPASSLSFGFGFASGWHNGGWSNRGWHHPWHHGGWRHGFRQQGWGGHHSW